MAATARRVGLRGERGHALRGRWSLLLLGAFLLACAGLAQTQQGHVLLRNVGLYETAATYTELTFSKPGDLPRALTKPNASVSVSFGIHNVSGDPRDYNWSVALVQAGKSQVKASGTVLTPAQGSTSITRSVVAACTGGRMQVVVRLASPAESLSFWMTCPPASAKKQAKQ